MYKEYNENPTCKVIPRGRRAGKKTIKGDCVIRAMSLALGKDWVETARALCERGIELGETQNASVVWESFLKKTELVPTKGKRMTVAECAEVSKQYANVGFVLHAVNHVVYVKDGEYYDAWDSGELKVFSMWEVA